MEILQIAVTGFFTFTSYLGNNPAVALPTMVGAWAAVLFIQLRY